MMVPIFFRAFSTVVTVVIAVAVSSVLGESATGKVWAAVIIAAVIAFVEWLLIWAPKHSSLARRLLDPRSVVLGTWMQEVRLVSGAQRSEQDTNRFAILWVDYETPSEYVVTGFAYDARGTEHSRWHSVGNPEFSKDGRSMTYRWSGTLVGDVRADEDPDRTGVSNLDLHSNTGRVEHVGENVNLIFDLERVTDAWLREMNLGHYVGKSLREHAVRDSFARSLAAVLGANG